jgi:hypothetical protein
MRYTQIHNNHEHGRWRRKFGMAMPRFYLIEPHSGEQFLSIMSGNFPAAECRRRKSGDKCRSAQRRSLIERDFPAESFDSAGPQRLCCQLRIRPPSYRV